MSRFDGRSQLGNSLLSSKQTAAPDKFLVLEALASEVRYHVLKKLLVDKSEMGLNIREVFSPFTLKRPAMSHHLGVLERAGLITRVKKGRDVYLKPQRDKLQELAALIADLLLI